MKITAYTAKTPAEKLKQTTFQQEPLNPTDLLIKVTHCGVCKSDTHFIDNDWGDSQFPLVPGHEVVGTIEQLGDNVKGFKQNQRVGIIWQQHACWQCEWCKAGKEELCKSLQAICLGKKGGFADYIVADSRFVFALPEVLASEHAAPLLCAGSTVFHALTSFNIKANQSVAILGIGGLGHLAIQFAKALGYQVTALTNSIDQFEDAKRFGADKCFLSDNTQALNEQFDFILSTIDEDLDYEIFINMLRPEGRLCFVGMPPKKIAISVFQLIIGQKSICASPMGNRQSIERMLNFAVQHNITPQVELMPLSQVNQALDKVRQGLARYRIVLCT